MKIAIQLSGNLPMELVMAWYHSVRRYMDHDIIHLTDMETPKLPFASRVQRIAEPIIMRARFRHLAQLKGNILLLDYDTLVQHDVSDVFRQDFDVALTKREWKEGRDKILYLGYPHNLGVIFSRNPSFWERVLNRFDSYPPNDGWMLAQSCVTEAAHVYRHDHKILELDAEKYNYTPLTQDEDVSGRFIVHYKGNRKHWMVDTAATRTAGQTCVEMAHQSKGFYTPDHPNVIEIMAEMRKHAPAVE